MRKIVLSTLLGVMVLSGAVTAHAASARGVLTEVADGAIAVSDCGSIRRFKARSESVGDDYTVDVWLPDDYEDGSATYPVVYMHDGQNLFDPSCSFAGSAWEVERAVEALANGGWIRMPIIVGVHNRGTARPSDYIPEKPAIDYIAPADRVASGMWSIVNNTFNGDEYAAFVACELKPAVDGMFRTMPDRDNTFIMGSSMGGLASVYAMCEYPEVFGGAACLSTHWIGNFEPGSSIYPSAMLKYLAENLPPSGSHRLYLDRGTVDLDSYYETWEEAARAIAMEKGYDPAAGSLMTFTDEGASHSEVYWALRVDRPLQFLLRADDRHYDPGDNSAQEFHILFQDAAYGWAQPHVFAWAAGVVHLGLWPGTPMTPTLYDGAPAWEVRFSHKVPPAYIIFDDGRASGAEQTANLPFQNNAVYDFNGVKGTISSGLVDRADADDALRFSLEGGTLGIWSALKRSLPVCCPDGRVFTIDVQPGYNSYERWQPGIYIIKGRKIAITR